MNHPLRTLVGFFLLLLTVFTGAGIMHSWPLTFWDILPWILTWILAILWHSALMSPVVPFQEEEVAQDPES